MILSRLLIRVSANLGWNHLNDGFFISLFEAQAEVLIQMIFSVWRSGMWCYLIRCLHEHSKMAARDRTICNLAIHILNGQSLRFMPMSWRSGWFRKTGLMPFQIIPRNLLHERLSE
jgi:hypothetical protein